MFVSLKVRGSAEVKILLCHTVCCGNIQEYIQSENEGLGVFVLDNLRDLYWVKVPSLIYCLDFHRFCFLCH